MVVIVVTKIKQKRSLHASYLNRRTSYLNHKAGKAIIELKQVFIQVSKPQHFDLEQYIRIETDVLYYAITKILRQLTSDNLGH